MPNGRSNHSQGPFTACIYINKKRRGCVYVKRPQMFRHKN